MHVRGKMGLVAARHSSVTVLSSAIDVRRAVWTECLLPRPRTGQSRGESYPTHMLTAYERCCHIRGHVPSGCPEVQTPHCPQACPSSARRECAL